VNDQIGPFTHHRQDLLDLARDEFQFLLDSPGCRLFVANEPALTLHGYVLDDIGFEFSFDWRDYAMTSYVCAVGEDGKPPPGLLINAGRRVRFHLDKVISIEHPPVDRRRKRPTDIQEYLRDAVDATTAEIKRIATSLRNRRAEAIRAARQKFAGCADQVLPPAVFPPWTYVQVVPSADKGPAVDESG
jgi:hypothetical protein